MVRVNCVINPNVVLTWVIADEYGIIVVLGGMQLGNNIGVVNLTQVYDGD